MTIYDGMILTFILIGIIIVIVSFLLSKYDVYVETEEIKKKTKLSDEKIDYDEVRQKIIELNEYGEYLKAELDKKHKELLFLYQMILEKQKEFQATNLSKNTKNLDRNDLLLSSEHKFDQEDNQKEEPSDKKVFKNSSTGSSAESKNFNKQIIDLSLAGYSSLDIAKKLKIGKGQVELVLNLYK